MSEVVPKNTRREIKFVSYDIHRETILDWLRTHQARFVTVHPDRWVNSVYFDNYDYAAVAENLLGASARTKVRYRWYGEEAGAGPAAGIFEVKQKRNTFGWKSRYAVPESPYRPGDTWRSVCARIIDQLPPEAKRRLQENPLPTFINRYLRKYFLSSDGKIRATVDTNQAVWDQRFKSHPNLVHRGKLPGTLVVEFKFNREELGLACEMLTGFPVRVSRHSKYINGIMAISGRSA